MVWTYVPRWERAGRLRPNRYVRVRLPDDEVHIRQVGTRWAMCGWPSTELAWLSPNTPVTCDGCRRLE